MIESKSFRDLSKHTLDVRIGYATLPSLQRRMLKCYNIMLRCVKQLPIGAVER
ncbi:hypothetical protein DI53_3944 [Sphingobacterium deserti]|uniref:Uncharacterized protein n=1 Tax=Sphingobacterium deserti TaxID=1229276 RepID=A0A0B8T4U9_9SPHI|nr:hypothetical protein DI53_3944 [Sphingobacterium deserti]